MSRSIVLLDNRDQVIQAFNTVNFDNGFEFIHVNSLDAALPILQNSEVSLLYLANRLGELDGLDIVNRVRELDTVNQPLTVILSDESEYSERVRQMIEDVDDFIRIPFVAQEIVLRAKTLLSELEDAPKRIVGTLPGFSGQLDEMNMMDLAQSLAIGGKSAIVHLHRNTQQGTVYMREGDVYDAELGNKTGRAAFFSLALWHEGNFRVEFAAADRIDKIKLSKEEIAEMGAAQFDDWEVLQDQFSDWGAVYDRQDSGQDPSMSEVSQQLIDIIDAKHSLREIVQGSAYSTVETLKAIREMLDVGAIVPLGGSTASTAIKADVHEDPEDRQNDATTQIMDNFVQGMIEKNDQKRKHQID